MHKLHAFPQTEIERSEDGQVLTISQYEYSYKSIRIPIQFLETFIKFLQREACTIPCELATPVEDEGDPQ